MITKRIFAQDMICNVVHFTVFYGIIILLLQPITGSSARVLWMLLTIVPFTVNFLIRRYVRSTVLVIITHLVAPALVFYLLGDWFLLGALVLMTIYSFVRRMNKRNDLDTLFGIFAAALLIIMCFVGIHLGHDYAAIIYPILVVIVVIGSELYSRMARVNSSLEAITQRSNQPIKQILKFDHKMMPTMVCILIIFTLAGRHAVVDPIFTLISQIRMPEIEINQTRGPITGPLPPRAEMLPMMVLEEQQEPHPFWEAFDAAIYFLMNIAIILLFITLFISGIITAYKLMSYKKRQTPNLADGEDEKIFITPEKVKRRRRGFEALSKLFARQENKTRRMFRKKILRYKKMGVPIVKSDTPRQMSKRIKQEDIKELTAEYENIRYGGD